LTLIYDEISRILVMSWARPEGDSNESPSLFPHPLNSLTGSDLRSNHLHLTVAPAAIEAAPLKLQVCPSNLQVMQLLEIR